MNELSLQTLEENTSELGDVGFPVQVYYIELSKMYMQRIRWHWHLEIEIIIINHGEADFLTDEKKIRLRPGEGILVNQNVMHSIQPIDDTANCSFYSVVFHPAFLFGYGNTVMSSKYLVPVISSPVFRIKELNERDPALEQIMDLTNNVIAANLTKRYGYELVIKSYLCRLWILLLEQVIPQNITKTKEITISTDETRVKDAIIYIEMHFNEPITLEQLAASIHISKSDCCRCFKRTLQVTPIEYLMKFRIFRATQMIQRNDPEAHSMSSLAFSVGFNNASYFNKVFKQFLGCTPSEYKRIIKNDPANDAGPFREFQI